MNNAKKLLIHGKRYESVSHYMEEKISAMAEVLDKYGGFEIVDITYMPEFHRGIGYVCDGLTHLIIQSINDHGETVPMFGFDTYELLCDIKHIRIHSIQTNPDNIKQLYIHYTID